MSNSALPNPSSAPANQPSRGICILGNDYVFDQVIALLNSIDVMMGQGFPVCIMPYDDRTERLAVAIRDRPHVQIYADQDSIAFWDHQAQRIWDIHPRAKTEWQKVTKEPYHRMGTHRRFCAFDGPFDEFIYMDADTLLLNDITWIFDKLQTCDWFVYDFQHQDIKHVYQADAPSLNTVFTPDRLATDIFCSGFYATKRGIFSREKLDEMFGYLAAGEAEILYAMAPDQTILNYWMMRSGIRSFNPVIAWEEKDYTGCCITCPRPFEIRNQIAYDRGNRLTYMHYIGIPSSLFRQICAGENWDCPYRELFLHYRYLHQPEARPQFIGKPKVPRTKPTITKRLVTRWKIITTAIRPLKQSYSAR
jgi:hypothetical protein